MTRYDDAIEALEEYAVLPNTLQYLRDLKVSHEAVQTALIHMVHQLEFAMTGMSHPDEGKFMPGVTDVDLQPDGNYKLSAARAALKAAEALR